MFHAFGRFYLKHMFRVLYFLQNQGLFVCLDKMKGLLEDIK